MISKDYKENKKQVLALYEDFKKHVRMQEIK